MTDILIIGAGIVGAAIGYGLARQGARVTLLDGDDTDHRAAGANFGLVWLQGKGGSMPFYHRLTRQSVGAWPGLASELADQSGTIDYQQNGGLTIYLSESEFEDRRAKLNRLHNAAGGEQDWEMVDVIVCRCEEVTAGRIREVARLGRNGPNQTKAFTRAGMGPCQGRQCGYTITRLLAEASGRPPGEIGFYRARPPLKPVTIGELATLEADDRA